MKFGQKFLPFWATTDRQDFIHNTDFLLNKLNFHFQKPSKVTFASFCRWVLSGSVFYGDILVKRIEELTLLCLWTASVCRGRLPTAALWRTPCQLRLVSVVNSDKTKQWEMSQCQQKSHHVRTLENKDAYQRRGGDTTLRPIWREGRGSVQHIDDDKCINNDNVDDSATAQKRGLYCKKDVHLHNCCGFQSPEVWDNPPLAMAMYVRPICKHSSFVKFWKVRATKRNTSAKAIIPWAKGITQK